MQCGTVECSTMQCDCLPRLRPEAPAAVALGGAVDLGELLAVVRALAPATVLEGGVSGQSSTVLHVQGNRYTGTYCLGTQVHRYIMFVCF